MSDSLTASQSQLRRVRRLASQRSERWGESAFVMEGPDLIQAALDAGSEIDEIFVEGSALNGRLLSLVERARQRGLPIFNVTGTQLAQMADAGTPQPILATAPLTPTGTHLIPDNGVVVVAHDVRDPGNLGTIIRSADAAGAAAVIVSGTSVDLFNPKVVRATAGSLFHVPVCVVSTFDDVAREVHRRGGSLIASVVRGGEPYRQATYEGLAAVVLGNEAHGLADAEVSRCDRQVSITMGGRAESLNVGIAGALLLFAACESRRGADNASASLSIKAHERNI